MWVAKNKTGEVILFYKKPKRRNGYWLSSDGKYMNISPDSFQCLTWESDPQEVQVFDKNIFQGIIRENLELKAKNNTPILSDEMINKIANLVLAWDSDTPREEITMTDYTHSIVKFIKNYLYNGQK